LVPI